MAEVTVTNVSAETTFTATYSNATATCIVTVQALTLSLSANKNVLSYFDSETATLTAVYSGGSGATIELYNAATSVKIGNFTDAGNGNYTYSYSSAGTGDISLMAKIGTLESSSVSIEDCIFYGINTNAFTIPSNATFTSDGSKITATTNTSGEKLVQFNHDFNQSDDFLYEVEYAEIGSYQGIAMCINNCDYYGGQYPNSSSAFASFGSDVRVSHSFAIGDKYKFIKQNGTTYAYINDTLIKSAEVSYNSTFTVGFYINRNRTQYYKNIKIKPI